jgi:hypothetical protein
MAWREIRKVKSSDGKRRMNLYARDDGLFCFAEFSEEIDDPEYSGRETYWIPRLESGLYDSAQAAERDAYAQIPWLRDNAN